MSKVKRKKIFTKEDNEAIYQKLNSDLDFLVSDKTRFHYFAGRRILLDIDEPHPGVLSLRIKHGYIEIYRRTRLNGKETCKSFGRYLLSVDNKDIVVDHENRNPLDNRRTNIRATTIANNLLNRDRFIKNNTYKGVTPIGSSFLIEVHSEYTSYRITLSDTYTEKDAAVIYDCISLKFNGLNHFTNFDKHTYSEQEINEIYDRFFDKIRIRDRSIRKTKKILDTF